MAEQTAGNTRLNIHGDSPSPISTEVRREDAEFMPYLGAASLRGELDGAGVEMPNPYIPVMEGSRCLKAGKSKYVIEEKILGNNRVFKVIAKYRNGKGIGSRMIKVLHPYKKNALEDKVIMRRLYEAKIPGAVKV